MTTEALENQIDQGSEKKQQVYDQVPIRFKNESETNLVVKSHTLAFSKTDLRLHDYKVFNAYISQVNPLGLYPKGMGFILTRKQISELTGIEESEVHRKAVASAERLSKIQFLSRSVNALDGEEEVEILNLIESARYKNGELYLKMTSKAEEHLIDLKRYGSFDIENQKILTSKYGMALMDMVCAEWHWKKGKTQDITLDLNKFKFACGLIDGKGKPLKASYARFSDFRNRVMDVAIKDLSSTNEFKITDVEYIRAGRSYRFAKLTCTRTKKVRIVTTDKNADIESRLAEHGIGQDKWNRLYMEAFIIAEALGDVTDKEVLVKCLDYVEEREDVQHFDKYFFEVLRLGIPFLPAWADPFGQFYKIEKKVVKDFVRQEIAPQAFSILTAHKEGFLEMSESEYMNLKMKGAYSDHYRPSLMKYIKDRKG